MWSENNVVITPKYTWKLHCVHLCNIFPHEASPSLQTLFHYFSSQKIFCSYFKWARHTSYSKIYSSPPEISLSVNKFQINNAVTCYAEHSKIPIFVIFSLDKSTDNLKLGNYYARFVKF